MVDSQGTQVKCALCHSILESGTALGPFTVSGTEKHVHLSCALFSSEVHLNPALLHDRIARKHETVIRRLLYAPLKDEKLASDLLRALPSALTNFEAILSRASSMDNGKCSRCRKVGATIACRFRDCPVNYHLNCVGNKTVNNEPIFCVPMAQIDPNELNLRPTRLMICSNHADVIPEWTYFVDDILRDEKVRLENTNCIDVSKLSPIYQMLFSQAARIVLFKPTSKTCI